MSLAEPGKPVTLSQHLNLGRNITADVADVLPILPPWAIADALRRLPEEELLLCLESKILPLVTLPGLRLFATFGAAARAAAEADGLSVVVEGTRGDFMAAVREAVGQRLLNEATRGLFTRFPARSAARRLTGGQFLAVTLALAAAAALGDYATDLLLAALSLLGGLFFLGIVALRILCLMPLPPRHRRKPPPLAAAELPVYSVLVPLYRETSVLGQLLAGLTSLDYPPEKLDIKLILEENDILMQRAVLGLRLPDCFDVIVVPSGLPQTKPKALNYALPFCRGRLLTIYDAEDIPEPNQLRLAAESFAAAPPDTACLQAQLDFYNPNENWLTRQFTIEYATLFGIVLPALGAHRLPIPLGGTSNHFRIDILRRIGAWDPHNVTEDADIGLRLARAGYDTGTIASRTCEEANTRLLNWLRQRARWLKGFLQTWLVHMRQPLRFTGEVGPAGSWVAQTMTLGVFASALLHPICLAATVRALLIGLPAPAAADYGAVAVAGLNLVVLAAGYVVAILAGARALRTLGITGWSLALATMPVYWLLMSLAAWLALWQFISAPFHWNKTEHGLSVFQRRRARAARAKP